MKAQRLAGVNGICWRNIAISLIDPATGVLSEIAFHEKAGRSQAGSFVFSLDKVFLSRRVATVATLPSALLVSDCSLGASWAFSFQPVLPP
ncbi:MAG: hypothetical protein LAO23_23705, partial [Acidobacteriia bacterium]|nr:hypothetical protein [Terriglobia bacterium]